MVSFSTTAVFMPSWAARIAATYPPGPEPMTMVSNDVGVSHGAAGVYEMPSGPPGCGPRSYAWIRAMTRMSFHASQLLRPITTMHTSRPHQFDTTTRRSWP